MIGVRCRVSSNFWRPFGVAQMLDVNDFPICHSMMIRTKGYQVAKVVSPTTGEGCDVVDMDMKIKSANSAPIVIADHGLLFDELPFPAVPVAIKMTGFGDTGSQTIAVAIIALLYLAGEFVNSATTIGARYGDLVLTARGRRQSLPLDIALAFTASYLYLGWVGNKAIAANGAGTSLFSTAIVTIVLASMLMGLYVPVLLSTLADFGRDYFAAATGAIDNIGLLLFGHHKSIIHA